MTDTKTCSKCGRTLPVSEFHRDNNSRCGRVSWCKECRRAYHRQYHVANRERILAQKREYQQANGEAIAERRRRYYAANRQQILAKARAKYHEQQQARAQKLAHLLADILEKDDE